MDTSYIVHPAKPTKTMAGLKHEKPSIEQPNSRVYYSNSSMNMVASLVAEEIEREGGWAGAPEVYHRPVFMLENVPAFLYDNDTLEYTQLERRKKPLTFTKVLFKRLCGKIMGIVISPEAFGLLVSPTFPPGSTRWLYQHKYDNDLPEYIARTGVAVQRIMGSSYLYLSNFYEPKVPGSATDEIRRIEKLHQRVQAYEAARAFPTNEALMVDLLNRLGYTQLTMAELNYLELAKNTTR